jgi:hypothetical protein
MTENSLLIAHWYQRLQVCRFKSGASVSSVADILILTIIVGFALLVKIQLNNN